MGDTVYVGTKPAMSYVTAVAHQFDEGDEVTLKARGRAISRAVDVAEIVRNRFLPDVEIASIETGTEELEDDSGSTRNVSTIEIRLKR